MTDKATRDASTLSRSSQALRDIRDGNLPWGSVHSDYMLIAKWSHTSGWTKPQVKPFQDIPMSPATSALHYGCSVFEGFKAYSVDKDMQTVCIKSDSTAEYDGKLKSASEVKLFRPLYHVRRLNSSARRLALPEYDEDDLMSGIKKLVRAERNSGWVPRGRGSALYIRPLLFASESSIGVRRSNEATLVVTCYPVGNYFGGNISKSVRLLVDPNHVRAWKGGVGFCKTGGSYACSIVPTENAKNASYDQILWTDGTPDHYVGECGQMNLFWVEWDHTTDRRILVTPELEGTILPGGTRDSILKLAVSLGVVEQVAERRVPVAELTAAISRGIVVEMFGSGTGAIIVPVECVAIDQKDYVVKTKEEPRDVSAKLREALLDIYHGIAQDKFSWLCGIEDEDIVDKRKRDSASR